MKQFDTIKKKSITKNSQRLTKLKLLLQNSKLSDNIEKSGTTNFSSDFSKNLSLYLSLIEKPINLLFSIDQFIFEFSKKTYQQKKVGEFFQQLKERKKVSLFYGHLSRKYIVNLFNKVKKNKGLLSKNVFCLLERRLDIVLYRSGLVKTIAEARQLILHKKIVINQKSVNFPAYLVEPGDIISMSQQTVNDVSHQLVKSLKIKPSKSNLKIVGDFFSKFKKNLDNLSPLTFEKKIKVKSFQSRVICTLFINLVCTQIKARSFCNLDKHEKEKGFFKKSFLEPTSLNLFRGVENSLNGNVLTFFKWKSFGTKLFEKNQSKLKHSHKSQKLFVFDTSSQNEIQGTLKRNPPYTRENPLYSLQKKPNFWSRNLRSHSVLKFNSRDYKKKNNSFIKNQKLAQLSKKTQTLWKQKDQKKNSILFKYRYCFLEFLKLLDNYKRFSALLDLNIKKSLYKKVYYKRKLSFCNHLTFRIIKPMHLEVSYKLLTVIYLYSPQRLNFPFSIDLDVINRSLS